MFAVLIIDMERYQVINLNDKSTSENFSSQHNAHKK